MMERSYLKPGGSPGWGVKSLMITFAVAMVAFVFWGSPLYPETLGLVPAKAFRGFELWRVFTAPLWFGSLDKVRIAPFVLGLVGLWALGSPLERWLGPRRLLVLFGAAVLLGHLGAALLGLMAAPGEALGGPAPGVWAVVAALCINYWNQQTWMIRPLPMRGRHLAYGLGGALGIALLLDWKDGLPLLPFFADALGAAVGALFVTRGWRIWQRRSRVRSRFVVLPGGAGAGGGRAGPGGNGKGNGNGKGRPGQPPKYWN